METNPDDPSNAVEIKPDTAGDRDSRPVGAEAARQALETPPANLEKIEPAPKTPELLDKKIEQAKQIMFGKYEKYGAQIEQFEAVQVGSALVVAYTGQYGLDLAIPSRYGEGIGYKEKLMRSWNAIHANPEDDRFMVEIDGEKLDTRKGMTYTLQEVLVSEGKIKIDGHGHPQVWVTGEEQKHELDRQSQKKLLKVKLCVVWVTRTLRQIDSVFDPRLYSLKI